MFSSCHVSPLESDPAAPADGCADADANTDAAGSIPAEFSADERHGGDQHGSFHTTRTRPGATQQKSPHLRNQCSSDRIPGTGAVFIHARSLDSMKDISSHRSSLYSTPAHGSVTRATSKAPPSRKALWDTLLHLSTSPTDTETQNKYLNEISPHAYNRVDIELKCFHVFSPVISTFRNPP